MSLAQMESQPSFLTVTESSILMKLKSLNPRKASGADGIPSWILKNYAEILGKVLTLFQYPK
jgi:hypothetical protein